MLTAFVTVTLSVQMGEGQRVSRRGSVWSRPLVTDNPGRYSRTFPKTEEGVQGQTSTIKFKQNHYAFIRYWHQFDDLDNYGKLLLKCYNSLSLSSRWSSNSQRKLATDQLTILLSGRRQWNLTYPSGSLQFTHLSKWEISELSDSSPKCFFTTLHEFTMELIEEKNTIHWRSMWLEFVPE